MNEMMEMAELEALTSGLKARKVQLERIPPGRAALPG